MEDHELVGAGALQDVAYEIHAGQRLDHQAEACKITDLHLQLFDIMVQNIKIQDKNRMAGSFFLHQGVEARKIVVAAGVLTFFFFMLLSFLLAIYQVP